MITSNKTNGLQIERLVYEFKEGGESEICRGGTEYKSLFGVTITARTLRANR